MSKQWQCEVCMEIFKRKYELVEHLHDEFDAHQMDADAAADQLRDLGEDL